MKRKVWAMGFAIGLSLLTEAFVLEISNKAYAAPKEFTNSFMMETCNGFSSEGTNPFFVLEPGFQLVLEGKEKKENVYRPSPSWMRQECLQI